MDVEQKRYILRNLIKKMLVIPTELMITRLLSTNDFETELSDLKTQLQLLATNSENLSEFEDLLIKLIGCFKTFPVKDEWENGSLVAKQCLEIAKEIHNLDCPKISKKSYGRKLSQLLSSNNNWLYFEYYAGNILILHNSTDIAEEIKTTYLGLKTILNLFSYCIDYDIKSSMKEYIRNFKEEFECLHQL